ncbi:hypothetical protein [Streptomyces iconiensis]|uniref:Uncharacterized protein n=1 Tax=Streptomyces iconiensis TaxID=1384038 RepID=A0ABT6ZXT0_9ACTN|nr:hypothetical protein [Streptomyces iconiensis]MDJ1133213.1 hypothetical protein [Streptomyces iconiensis]
MLQSRLLYAAAAVLMAASAVTAYNEDGLWPAVLLGCAAVMTAALVCLPAAALPVGRTPRHDDRVSRVRRVLLIFAGVMLTAGAIHDVVVEGEPRLALMVAAVGVGALASWRAVPPRGDRDAEVDGTAGLPAQQHLVQERNENPVE